MRDEWDASETTVTTNVASPVATGAAALTIVLCAQQAWEPSSRHVLSGVTRVELRRGARGVERGRKLVLMVPDQRMSALHGELRCEAGRWHVEDLGSKNGVLREGVAVRGPTVLEDGDVIEMGRTFFVFHAPRSAADNTPLDVTADDVPLLAPGLATLAPSLATQFAALARAAATTIPILLHGETGTGKELAARAVHALSGRGGLFMAVNCGGLPRSLLESELFGFRKGSFSGASSDRIGAVAASHGGTLFLDEVAELPLDGQAALLRVLQEREVTPIGATRAQAIDLRVVSASHRNLALEVASGRFRADLYGRLQGFELALPALRDRRADLGLIVHALVERIAPGGAHTLSHAAARAVFARAWPGNVRELERALQLAIAMRESNVLELAEVAEASVAEERSEPPLPDELERLLREHRGNVTQVARVVGKAREQVHRWIRRAGIDAAEYRRVRPRENT